jgi:hypothetical protein
MTSPPFLGGGEPAESRPAGRVLGRTVGLARPRWESRSRNAEGPAAIGELRAQQRKRVAAIRKLNARYAGQTFPKRATEKWNRLNTELDETQELITELRARCERHHRGA